MPDTAEQAELLAPAGDWEALRAAVANGADAVYFGLSDFNARHRATNFTAQELPEVMAYLHAHNVRGYVTFNTLIFSDELPRAVDSIKALVAGGADALIVQDLGVVRLIKTIAPGLAVHGSTQMTLTEPAGIGFVQRLGVERVIVGRELSIDDIARIRLATNMPLEAFVHGALCVAYSGQCLTSESIGGRSANRGQCAQACRLPYDLVVDDERRDLGDVAYLLSPKDLAAPDLVGRLVEAGLTSLKIEGRLKSAHYVAAATQTYRAALDAALRGKAFALSPDQHRDLAQSFSRGFSHGFLSGVDHQQLVHGRFPKSRGLRVGTVVARSDRGVMVQFDAERSTPKSDIQNPKSFIPIRPGDGVVFDEGHPEQDEQGGRVFEVRPIHPQQHGQAQGRVSRVEIGFARGDVNLQAVALGAIVWKTDDPAVRRRLEQSFKRDVVAHREAVKFSVLAEAGRSLRITLTDGAGRRVEVASDAPMEEAQKHPLTTAVLREQLGRLGDTPFELGDVELVGPHGRSQSVNVMVPKSVLNELRRQAVGRLLEWRAEKRATVADDRALERLRDEARRRGEGPHASPLAGGEGMEPALSVMARSMEQLRAVVEWSPEKGVARPVRVYCDFEDPRKYKDAVALARAGGMPIGLATVRVVKPHEHGLLRHAADAGPDAVLVRNLAAVELMPSWLPGKPLIGDYSLNVANELSADLFLRHGLSLLTPSYDLNWSQLQAMLARIDPGVFEVVVHQHMPMFHMEHCVFAHTLSQGKDYRDCGRPCETHRVELRDRTGVSHPLRADVGCRNTLYNGVAQSAAGYIPRMIAVGLRRFRVELLREESSEVVPMLGRYARVLAGRDDGRSTYRMLHVLHQLGVTAGTLEHA